ncbi:MAG: PH domain-containing protein [Coriobacteriales bacterium]|jgi:putative membrane protein|nr:PH domain-containing protein [Coriobacteriales bacterium]
MSDPRPTVAGSGWQRIHPLYVLSYSLRAGLGIVIAGVAVLIGALGGGRQGGAQTTAELQVTVAVTLIVLLLALLLVIVISLIYYLRFRWRIGDAELEVSSGLIFRNHLHVPFSRIQSVELSASLVERFFGLTKLKVETAGGSANQSLVIPALKLGQAESLRLEIFKRKENPQEHISPQPGTRIGGDLSAFGQTALGVQQTLAGARGLLAGPDSDQSRIEYEYHLSLPQLVFSALTSDSSGLILLILVGIVWRVFDGISNFYGGVAHTASAAYRQLSQAAPLLIVGAVLTLVVIALAASVVATLVSLAGFRGRRRAGRIEIEYGLLSHRSHSIAINRIQQLKIRQGCIRRWFGYAQVRLMIVSSRDNSKNQNKNLEKNGVLIHPFIKTTEVPALLEQLLPEYGERPQLAELQRLPKVARRRAVTRRLVRVAPFCLLALAAVWLPFCLLAPTAPDWLLRLGIAVSAVVVLVALFCLLLGLAWYRHAGYAWNQHFLCLHKGSLALTTMYLAKPKIQWGAARVNPFQAHAQVATIAATSAAGAGGAGTSSQLYDLCETEANAYLDWLKPARV